MTEYQFGKLYKLQTHKRLYDKAFDSSYMVLRIEDDPKVIESLRKNEIIIVLAMLQTENWDEYKVMSQNGNIGWIDNISEEYYGFLKEVNPLRNSKKV